MSPLLKSLADLFSFPSRDDQGIKDLIVKDLIEGIRLRTIKREDWEPTLIEGFGSKRPDTAVQASIDREKEFLLNRKIRRAIRRSPKPRWIHR